MLTRKDLEVKNLLLSLVQCLIPCFLSAPIPHVWLVKDGKKNQRLYKSRRIACGDRYASLEFYMASSTVYMTLSIVQLLQSNQ